MGIYIDKRQTTEVKMRPVCECGHVFNKLIYNYMVNMFIPRICPRCHKVIETVRYKDLSKCILAPDESGDISICE